MRLAIDTDPGIDDALALLLALATPGAEVVAITTVAGNVGIDRATANALRILDVARPAAMPALGRGAASPLRRELVTAHHVHGDDGLAGLHRYVEADGRPRYPEVPTTLEMRDAADVILDLAGSQGPELTLVALGPLTNVARALSRDPGRLARIRRIVVMGGAIAVPGNVTAGAEFNFYVDPDAADLVLSAGLPVELVPLDVTRRVVLRPAALAARVAPSAPRAARFAADLTRDGFEPAGAKGEAGMALHDPLAVAVALDPSLVSFEPLHVAVETEGRVTRGLSLADRRPGAAERARPNCRVAMDVDAARCLALVLDRLCPASS